MTTTSINVANSNQPSTTKRRLEVGRHFKMTITQDNKKVADIDTDRKQDNEIYQANQGKLKSVNALSLRDKRYDSIMYLAGLDGDRSNISYKDLRMAKEKLQRKFDITNTRWDGDAGKLTVIFSDNTEMIIDVETESEQKTRIYNEKKKAEAAKKQAQAEKKAADEKKPTYGDYVGKLGIVHGTMHYVCDKLGIPM